MVGSSYRSWKYIWLPVTFYICKFQIRLKESISGLELINPHRAVQNYLHGLVRNDLFSNLQHLAHKRNVASLVLHYRYFHPTCSDKLYILVPRFTPTIRHTISKELNFPLIINVRWIFSQELLVAGTITQNTWIFPFLSQDSLILTSYRLYFHSYHKIYSIISYWL